jgi:predicted nucleotidyltransferase
LDEFGWIATPPDEDLGEDFIVHIYLDGRATGVTFHVQEKSVTNLHERRKGDFLVYDFEVKDLKHWESFSLPVVLVVWDIELRKGRWALIDDVISDLDQRRPNWRENKSKASVYIPWDNTTDDAGLIKLKQGIGHRLFPIIAGNKPLEIQFKREFPNTDEGKAAYEAIDRAIKEGEPITIQGFRELNFSNWFMSWFGEFDPQKATISLGPPPSVPTFLVRIDIISTLGETAILPIIELKMIKVGSEVAQLSNQHQNSALHFLFKVPDLTKTKEGTVTISLNHLGHNVYETREVLRFLQAVSSGGELRLTPLTEDKLPIIVYVSRNLEKKPPLQFMQLVDKVCIIQDKISQFLRIPDEGPTDADIQAINELAIIVEQGKNLAKTKEITWEFKEEALDILLDLHRHNKLSHFTILSTESWVELFEAKIPTGPMTRHVTGKIAMSLDELESSISALTADTYLPIKFINVEIVEIFPDWFIREAQRLSQLLAEKFGVEAVYLFGSLVWNDIHTPETDIDLALSGLPEEQFLEAVSYLERESKFPIDLVDLSKVSNHLRQRILTEGKLLYEREAVAAFG